MSEVVVRELSDGTCSAEGCDLIATRKTLMGIAFCVDHFVAFYTGGPEDGPALKAGIIQLQPVPHTEPAP